MLELWEMWSILSLPLLPGPLWPREVVPERVLSMGQIKLLYTQVICLHSVYAELNCLII